MRPVPTVEFRRLASLLAFAGLLLAAAFAVYWRALSAPLLFDDRPAIARNESIRQLWPPDRALSPPVTAAGAAGRPIVNLSLAFNYALGGLEVRSYHVFNVTAHALTGLLLFALVRHALGRLPAGGRRTALAGAITLLWLVHPLQTETVICVVQRNEILFSFFLLLTLYALTRAAEAPGTAVWPVLAVAACALGMASKEAMAAAPLLALLYDRTFLSGSFAAAWRQRGRLHLALAGTWLLLAWLVLGHEQRAGTVGFGLGVTSWDYLLTQCRALTTYLHLVFWPQPLVLDYGLGFSLSVGEVAGRGLLLLALFGGTLFALRRHPAAGFAAAAWFLLLAPSSSFVPLTTQPIAEHRMYLPLAAVLALLVPFAHRLAPRGLWPAVFALGLAGALLTVRRSADYRSEETIWQDTIAKVPTNPRALASLAGVRVRAEQWEEAVTLYEQALQRHPDYADAHNDLGAVLSRLGRHEPAIAHHTTAWRLKPEDTDVRFNLGLALQRAGRPAEAIAHFEAVIRQRPQHAAGILQLGDALLQLARPADALRQFERALALDTANFAAHNNAAVALAALQRPAEALAHYAQAEALQPDNVDVRVNHGDLLLRLGRPAAAARCYEEAVRRRPAWTELYFNLGNIRLQEGEFAAAERALATAVRLRPDWVPARHNLALALTQLGRNEEAIGQHAEIVRLSPTSASARHNLAQALAAAGRPAAAMAENEAALQLQPDFAPARRHLEELRRR